MQLTAAASFTVNNIADLTVAGHLSGSSTLTKKGVGTMTLTNDNTVYTGAIDVQTGRLIMTNIAALGGSTRRHHRRGQRPAPDSGTSTPRSTNP